MSRGYRYPSPKRPYYRDTLWKQGFNGNYRPRVPREVAREVACPYCGAYAGEPCVGKRGKPRESNHMERLMALGEDRLKEIRSAQTKGVGGTKGSSGSVRLARCATCMDYGYSTKDGCPDCHKVAPPF